MIALAFLYLICIPVIRHRNHMRQRQSRVLLEIPGLLVQNPESARCRACSIREYFIELCGGFSKNTKSSFLEKIRYERKILAALDFRTTLDAAHLFGCPTLAIRQNSRPTSQMTTFPQLQGGYDAPLGCDWFQRSAVFMSQKIYLRVSLPE